jgi:hypothetical protein
LFLCDGVDHICEELELEELEEGGAGGRAELRLDERMCSFFLLSFVLARNSNQIILVLVVPPGIKTCNLSSRKPSPGWKTGTKAGS